MKDYFNILGVEASASEDEIKRAYRSLAMKHHPDRGGDQTQFQEIQEAYSVLTDPQKRAEWEAHRHGNPFGHPGGFHFNFNFGGPGHPFDINDIFDNIRTGQSPFGGFQQQQRRNRDLKVAVDLDLASTLEPQTKHISVLHLNGSRHTVTVEIPRGVNNSVQMKYSGHGDSSYKDLPPGDLYIQFRVHETPDFIVEGLDVVKNIRISFLDALVGRKIKVRGLDGKEFEITIPPGLQYGSRLRIAQQGLWALNQPIRGNFIVQVELRVPTDFTAEQFKMLEQIAEEHRSNTGNES